jgi:hypothetical protein
MRARTLAASLLAWTGAAPALACSICHTPTALGVRHQLFQHDFAANAAAIAAPIPILLAAILLVAREPRRTAEAAA